MLLNNRTQELSGFQSLVKTWLVLVPLMASLVLLAGCQLNKKKQEPIASAPANQSELVKQVQTMLDDKGFQPGPIDGIEGPATRAALDRYQTNRGLPKTGRVNKTAFDQLVAENKPTSSPAKYSSASEQMRSDSKYANQSSYIQACGSGLFAGSVIGLITGKDSKDRKKKVLQYGGAGCLGALGANYWLQSDRKGAAYDEAEKMEMLATIRDENRKLSSLVKSSKAVVAEDREKIEQINSAYSKKQISLDEAKSQMAEVDKNKEHLEKTLAKLEERKTKWESLSGDVNASNSSSESRAIDTEIASLEAKIGILKSELNSLEQTRSVSSIG